MEREEYIDSLAAKLKEWNAEIEKLEAKARKAGAESSKEISKEIQNLRARKNKAEYKLDDLKETGKASWKELQAETEDAVEDIKSSLENAVNRFKDV